MFIPSQYFTQQEFFLNLSYLKIYLSKECQSSHQIIVIQCRFFSCSLIIINP